jgi:hypothetical protein
MPDQRPSERAPAQPEGTASEASHDLEPRRSHRAIVWSLVVLASLLLVLSITANWIQSELLDTDRVVDTTDQILAKPDVQEALATYTVDQLYANVDVQRELQERLPPPVKGLAAPAAAAARQLAVDVQLKALASPRVQDLTSDAIRLAHEQLVGLITDQSTYVSSTGGQVTLEYGRLIADLASRVGVSPDAISRVQGVVRGSKDLEQRLTQFRAKIQSARAALSRLEQGELSPETQQRLAPLRENAAELRGNIARLHKGVTTAQAKAPPRLQAPLAQLDGLLVNLEQALTAADQRIRDAVNDPSLPNVEALNARLANLEAKVTALLGRQVVQNPGQLVVLKSSQLDGVQTLVRVLRNLGFVLPLLVLLLYGGALYLAKGWRPRALLAAGGGILAAGLVVLVASRLLGDAVVDSVAGSGAVEPAVRSVWEILSEGLRERTLFVLAIGLAFVAAGLLAGPTRRAAALRRHLAPHLRDRPAWIYIGVGLLFLLWLAFAPGIHLGQVLAIAALAVLALVGIEALRRQTALEFPPSANGS